MICSRVFLLIVIFFNLCKWMCRSNWIWCVFVYNVGDEKRVDVVVMYKCDIGLGWRIRLILSGFCIIYYCVVLGKKKRKEKRRLVKERKR